MTSTDPSAIDELVRALKIKHGDPKPTVSILYDAAEALIALSAERDEAIVKVAEWIAAGWQERADAAEAELTGAQATIADHLAAELEWGRVSEYQQGKIARLSDSLCAADAFAIAPNGRGGSRITLDFEDVKSAYDSFTALSDEYNARSALQGDSQP